MQGIYRVVNDNVKQHLRRSLAYDRNIYYPLDSDSTCVLGVNYAIGVGNGGIILCGNVGAGMPRSPLVQAISDKKHEYLKKLCCSVKQEFVDESVHDDNNLKL